MSTPADRIAVPTNGHRRPSAPAAEVDGASSPTEPEVAVAVAAADPGEPLRAPFTPGQAAVGFSIIAGLILLVLGRRRGKG